MSEANAKPTPCALIMAGGTGGHIFPGIAVGIALREQGWRVHWLGAPNSMESDLVPPHGFPFEPVNFGGVRGKGLMTWLRMPWRLMRSTGQALKAISRVKPDVVVGMGGYITVPGGLATLIMGRTMILHEQNSRAGLANRVLSWVADRVYTAFPHVLDKGLWVGNPLREAFIQQDAPAERFANRSGPLQIVVVGGSLGARALNDTLPAALALMPAERRPKVLHQSGKNNIEALEQAYTAAGVDARTTPFIDNTAEAFAQADLVIARSGASTVTELAAVGAAALFIPFPHAVDDHQTSNAAFLVDKSAGWMMSQPEFTPERVAQWLSDMDREQLLQAALKAKALARTGAVRAITSACSEVIAR
ncbi:MAG: undecaprenyldiphospho-muramoylpentapeptide beta-N-acetylglucosaminyltransferase [Pseudomonadota bacterium]|jgi:UDP-N-acetylglucosamine--N-acetylmuramyl-(pentapeptide) pyrophosphoryl-undecaprenol N-acetylglucosamine transferase